MSLRRHTWATLTVLAACSIAGEDAAAQQRARKLPLRTGDIDVIVALERIEDRRDFDADALRRAASSSHQEVRRRAALAVARLYEARGRELLNAMRTEPDTEVLATVVWATGQLIDTTAVPWLDSLLRNPATPVGVAKEAAGAFGKIRTIDTFERLSRYLGSARPTKRATPVVTEALLSAGRHDHPRHVAAIARWSSSSDPEIRWRTAWALTRSQHRDAVPVLVKLAQDASAETRYWAMRGLRAPLADSSGVGVADMQRLLVAGLSDPDRRVRVEALNRLSTYPDTTLTISRISLLVTDEDPWIATSAADALGRFGTRATAAMPLLREAIANSASSWTRASALYTVALLDRQEGLTLAMRFSTDTSWVVRDAAIGALARLGRDAAPALERLAETGGATRGSRGTIRYALFALADSTMDPAARRKSRQEALASSDDVVRMAAAGSMSSWADSTDIPMLLDAVAVAMRDSSPVAAWATIEVLADIESRGQHAADAFFRRFPTPPSDIIYALAGRAFGPKTLTAWGPGRPAHTTRTDSDYRRIVDSLVVPAYNGARPPRLRWQTTRGAVETELNSLDAPLATDYLLDLVRRGTMHGIRFVRVVPNFVAQQEAVLFDQPLQRDEISRGRLLRGNLSWGTNIGNARRFGTTRGPGAAYDTGPANYTFGVTAQPHNEGDFTALGRIVGGMDVVDRIERGDVVRSVRRVP